MSKPTVHAVVKVTLEVEVRPSGADETLAALYEVAKREAEAKLRTAFATTTGIRIVGTPTFSHAIVRDH